MSTSVSTSVSVECNQRSQIPTGLLHAKLPNRPLPAFNLFFQEERKEILGRYVGSPSNQPSYANILKFLETKWRSLTPQERHPYNDAASKEKVRFANELVMWNRKQDVYNKDLRRQSRMQRSSRKARGTISRLWGGTYTVLVVQEETGWVHWQLSPLCRALFLTPLPFTPSAFQTDMNKDILIACILKNTCFIYCIHL